MRQSGLRSGMTVSRFWRSSEDVLSFSGGVPLEIQRLEARYFNRISIGQGIVVGKLSEQTECSEINYVGVIDEVIKSELLIKVNWRNADFTLKPTPSGKVYWRKSAWFNFADEVVDRYLLEAIFSDIFDEENWRLAKERRPLLQVTPRVYEVGPSSISGTDEPLSGLPLVRTSSNPTEGYVYLIWSQYGYKIGKAVNVQKRTKLFEVKLPFPIRVEHYARFSDYTQAERSLHLHFHEKRMEGEWFSLDESDVAFIKTLGEPQPTGSL